MIVDRAWKKTERMLRDAEKRVARVYSDNPLLKPVIEEYEAYMDMVTKATESLFKAFREASEYSDRLEKKKAYIAEVKRLTIQAPKYRRIAKKYAIAMSKVNQEALDIVNDSMASVYAVNYNSVADKCRKYGIKVNGQTEV